MVEDVAKIIREALDNLPNLKYKFPEYPEIHKDDVYIGNEMWTCDGMRKIHLETGVTQNLEVLHCVWYPNPEYNLPIFGCDIVDTGKTITAAIVDVSPVRGTEKIYDRIRPICNLYNFSERRALPLWGDEIFSPHCKFMRINSRVEKYNYQSLVKHLLTIYCEEINNAVRDENWVNTMLRFDDQIYYCKQQRKNKKTIAVLSKWFDKEWARNYIDTVLFDVPVMKVSPDGSTVQK